LPHKNAIDCELLLYRRFGLGKYAFLARVNELADFQSPSAELVQRLQNIIDEAFGRENI
jgi:hypothetical protein